MDCLYYNIKKESVNKKRDIKIQNTADAQIFLFSLDNRTKKIYYYYE